jgi:hypothetical protein
MNDSIVHNKITPFHIKLIQSIHGINQKLYEMLTTSTFSSVHFNYFSLAIFSLSFLRTVRFFFFFFFSFFLNNLWLTKYEINCFFFSQMAPIIDSVMPLFAGLTTLAGIPLFVYQSFYKYAC